MAVKKALINERAVEVSCVERSSFEDLDAKSVKSNRDEVAYDESDFDDPEDFVDDVDDEEIIPDLLEKKPRESFGIDNVIVIDGIPVVQIEKINKLKEAIRKIYSKIGPVINEHYPVTKENKTKGYCFLELENKFYAVKAVNTTNNHRLDKTHTFLVSLLSDFEKYEKIPEDWKPPEEQPFQSQGNRKFHLLEPDACDQYLILSKGGQELGVYLNSLRGIGDPKELEVKSNWTESSVKWSPQGSYLATCHSKGIAIWGCEDFTRIARFSHDGVQFFDFSPCENYLITSKQVNRNAEPNMIIVWETKTGVKKRSFDVDQFDNMRWPIFKWSYNDNYFAGITIEGALSVYETTDFGLLDKKSIKITGIIDFSWSPTQNTLAYWVAEENSVPARVVLIELPSKNEIRRKPLSNVADCKMYWQKSGHYLCVKTDRYSKIISSKQKDDTTYRPQFAGLYYNFEIFHMKEKQIPVDSIEIKEDVHSFAWEPVGSNAKFAIIHGDIQALNVSFYEVRPAQTPVLKKKYERRAAELLFWSPQGRHIVLAGLRNSIGLIECIDTMDFTLMSSGEHSNCTDVEWDPTGRYFMTGVSWWKTKVDNAYWLWSFQGKLLKRFSVGGFCQLLWRPRPLTILTIKDIKEIKKNLQHKCSINCSKICSIKEYSQTFDEIDQEYGSKKSKELLMMRRKLYDEFKEFRNLKIREYESQKRLRLTLRNGQGISSLDSDSDMAEEIVEFLVSEERIEL